MSLALAWPLFPDAVSLYRLLPSWWPSFSSESSAMKAEKCTAQSTCGSSFSWQSRGRRRGRQAWLWSWASSSHYARLCIAGDGPRGLLRSTGEVVQVRPAPFTLTFVACLSMTGRMKKCQKHTFPLRGPGSSIPVTNCWKYTVIGYHFILVVY